MSNAQEYIWQLITEKLAGTISAEDERYLDELIYSDPSIRQAYQDLRSLFGKEDIDARFSRLDDDGYWDNLPEKITQLPVKRRFPLVKVLTAAAVVTGLVIGVYYFFSQRTASLPEATDIRNISAATQKTIELQLADGRRIDLGHDNTIDLGKTVLASSGKALSYKSGADDNGWNTLVVPGGQDYKVMLSDGTEIWLNAATALQFPFSFSGNGREIRLHGEAYIKAAAGADKPFRIQTPNGVVQVLGTEFNLNTYDAGTLRVALVTGSVQMNAGGRSLVLKPGMQAVYAGSDMQTQAFKEEEVLSWRKGLHYFSDATLEEVSRVLPRWYGVTVVLDRPDIANNRFTGYLNRNKPVTEFLENLRSATGLQYYHDKDSVLHLK
jgi:transmembrane sensor